MDWYNSWERFIIKFVESGGITTSISFILTFWGCYIALRGLNTWRQQVIERPRIELARKVMEQFLDIQGLIKQARTALIRVNAQEIRNYFKKDDLTEEQCLVLHRLYVIEKNEDKILSFQELRHKAIVYYSSEIQECFNKMLRIIKNFQNACLFYSREIGKSERNKKISETTMSIYMDQICDKITNDEINIEMDKIIKEVECNLKPFYKTKKIKWKQIDKVKELKDE